MANIIFEPALALADVVEQLRQFHFRHFLVGSFASGFRGEFRATNDLDIVCEFSEGADEFLERMKAKFYCDEIAAAKAIESKTSFNVIHERTFVKVDFFTRISEFEAEQFALCTSLQIPGTEFQANVSTAEYNIIAKLNWYLKSNRVLERQLLDVKSMIAINRETLDHGYLHRWAEHFRTVALLNEMLAAAGL